MIVSLFSILEALSPDLQDKEEDGGQGEGVGGDEGHDDGEESTSSFFGKVLQEKKKDYENYNPFCKTEFVSALCEGLNELLKNPKPRKVQKMTSTHTHENHGPLGKKLRLSWEGGYVFMKKWLKDGCNTFEKSQNIYEICTKK